MHSLNSTKKPAFYIRFILLLTVCSSLCGCLTFSPFEDEENPSEWMRKIVKTQPTWRLMLDQLPNDDAWLKFGSDVRYQLKGHDTIAFSCYGKDSWIVKSEFGTDAFEYSRADNETVLLSTKKTEQVLGYLDEKSRAILLSDGFGSNDPFVVLEPVPQIPFVFFDVARVFKDNPWCNTIWIDDGCKGMLYFRGKVYDGRVMTTEELDKMNLLPGVFVPAYYRIGLESTDYKTFCEKSSEYLADHPKKSTPAP
ncbi:MAG: hypothetical protein JXR40_05255 [Pontiellaceae bacterium]|nr:hypothetical protein [Pontiellaceae bacterium]